jgi:Domain of unknown function (DUF6268)
MTISNLFRAGALAVAPLAATVLLAQTIDGLAPLRPGESAATLDASISGTGSGAVHFGGVSPGNISVCGGAVSAVFRQALNERAGYSLGLAVETFNADKPSLTPVPTWLGAVALNAGGNYQFDRRLGLMARVALGTFSDLSSTRRDTWNASGVIGVLYAANPDLFVFGGVLVDGFARYPVLPAAGLRWKFAPDWTLNLLYPAPRIEYRVSKELRAYAGLFSHGGGFRVAEDFGTKFGRPALNNALVDFREWGFGPGLSWNVTETVHLQFTAGYTFRREWDFHRAEFKVKADNALFVQCGATARF